MKLFYVEERLPGPSKILERASKYMLIVSTCDPIVQCESSNLLLMAGARLALAATL